MPKIAIIGGSGFNNPKFLDGFMQNIIKTQYGNVLLYQKAKIIFLPRHGKGNIIPPHRINHRANICALNMQGVEKIIGVNSVGSLKASIKPGSFLVPDEYIDFSPQSFFDFELKSITPSLNEKLRKEISDSAKKAKIPLKNKGVYIQTRGPRFETKAEVRIISKWADVVGMTMCSEATLSQEVGIPYACLCSIDNYANGISKKVLSVETLKDMQKKNQPKVEKIVMNIIKQK